MRENIKLRKSNSLVAQVHAINTLLNRLRIYSKSCKAKNLFGQGQGRLLKAKDLALKAKDSKFVLEDISRPKTTALSWLDGTVMIVGQSSSAHGSFTDISKFIQGPINLILCGCHIVFYKL